MACPACRQHVQEAGAYRWAAEQARALLRHEFDCQGAGGPNALLGCLVCVLDRLALRVSPEISLAAARQPWLERAAALIRQGSDDPKERGEILAGLDRAEQLATARVRAAERQAERAQTDRERQADRRRATLTAPPPAPPPKPKKAGKDAKRGAGKGAGGRAVRKVVVASPGPPAGAGAPSAPEPITSSGERGKKEGAR